MLVFVHAYCFIQGVGGVTIEVDRRENKGISDRRKIRAIQNVTTI